MTAVPHDTGHDHGREESADPWPGGPVHHPTRFDLPIPAEPPF